MRRVAAAFAAMVVAVAVPAAAQMPAMTSDAAPRRGNPLLMGMSPAGRAIMRSALQEADPRAAKEATAVARDHMIAAIDNDRLDAAALRRAMEDERETVNSVKARQQAAMLNGIVQLSLGDRRILAANMRAVRTRVEDQLNRRPLRADGPPLPR